MKNIGLLIVSMLMLPLWINAQEESVELFSVPLSDANSPGKLIVEQLAGSIDVLAYEGSEVVVKASFGNKKAHYKEEKEKSGLRRIQNSSLKISAEEKNNVVRIINEQWDRATNLEIKVPKNFSLKLGTVNQGNINVKGVSGEMEVSNVNGEITLEGIGGSALADTVNGDIKVGFVSVTPNVNMAFSSLNGDLDVTFPNSVKSDLKLKSEQGDIYTDFEMVTDKQKAVSKTDKSSSTYKVEIEQWVRGKLNGGGPEMLFKTFNGDIIIRSN
ncbi:DUF4097 family beta strand repeat-containing protein [Ulvibacterium marinum]|nr:DUF4097 family beta strand repeat-containing protein [Ulvibacterium marinum]